MHAKAGKNVWPGIDIGTYGLHDERNDNRTHLTYAVQHMVTGGTLLPHRNIYKETWHGCDRLTSDDPYMGRTAPLTYKRFILYIYSTNIGTEYFKHALYYPSFLFKMQFVS